MKAKYFRRSSVAALVLAFAFLALPGFRAVAKESADEALVREGRRSGAGLDYYVEGGAMEDAERLLFNPATMTRERSFRLGEKIGMAELYLMRHDDAGLIDAVKARGESSVSRVTAGRWEKSGQIEQANFELAGATWYGLAAKLLAARGR